MSEFDLDLFVIGGGSGGVRAARMAASRGVRVALAEEKALGGTCVNVGCVPKKLFVYAAHFAHIARDGAGYGWSLPDGNFSWPTLRTNKDREIERLNGIYGRLLDGAGVERIAGRARICGPHSVEVAGQRYRARYILVATGSRPFVPSFPGSEHVSVSDAMFYLESLPKRLVVVGAGYIACEFACLLNSFGVEVCQVVRGKTLLRGFDRDVQSHLEQAMRDSGIALRFGVEPTHLEQAGEAFTLTLSDGNRIACDRVLAATGRRPNSADLGVEAVDLELSPRGAIVVDDHFKSSVDSIYALGDVIDRWQLTPVALAEAMALVATLFDEKPTVADYANIPTAVFTKPEVATVGLSEEHAVERFGNVRIYRSSFRPMFHTMTGASDKMMMKLVVEEAGDRVVGVHLVGDHAAEILQGFAVALKMGATKADFDATVGIHPTAAEELVTMRTPVASS